MKQNLKDLLKSLEATREEFWNIDNKTGQFLNLLIRDRQYKAVLEIGSSNGYSGIWIAEALSHHNGQLYTMESNKKTRYPLAVKNFEKSGLTQFITPILGHAPEDIPDKPETFDIAFFDATKYEHTKFFEKIKTRISKGGLIVTDNIISHKEDLTTYTNLISTNNNWNSVVINIGNGLMLSHKIN